MVTTSQLLAPEGLPFIWLGWRFRVCFFTGKPHPLTILFSDNTQNRFHRRKNLVGNAAEPTTESDMFIGDHKISDRHRTNIQDNLTIFYIVHWYRRVASVRVDDQIGRTVVIKDPLVYRPENIGHRGTHGHCSCSIFLIRHLCLEYLFSNLSAVSLACPAQLQTNSPETNLFRTFCPCNRELVYLALAVIQCPVQVNAKESVRHNNLQA